MKNIVNPRVLAALNGGDALAIPIIIAGVMVAFFMGPTFERIYIVFLISMMVVIGISAPQPPGLQGAHRAFNRYPHPGLEAERSDSSCKNGV